MLQQKKLELALCSLHNHHQRSISIGTHLNSLAPSIYSFPCMLYSICQILHGKSVELDGDVLFSNIFREMTTGHYHDSKSHGLMVRFQAPILEDWTMWVLLWSFCFFPRFFLASLHLIITISADVEVVYHFRKKQRRCCVGVYSVISIGGYLSKQLAQSRSCGLTAIFVGNWKHSLKEWPSCKVQAR